MGASKAHLLVCYHKSTGRAFIWDGQIRKRIYLGKWPNYPGPLPPALRDAYRAAVAQISMRPEAIEATQPGPVTLAELVARFLEWAEVRYKGGPTVKNLEYSIRPALDLFRAEPAASFGPKRLQEVRQLMARQGRTRQGINMAAGYIRQMFKWAVAEELIQPDQLVALTSLAPLRYGAVDAPESPAREAVAKEVAEATLPHLSPTVATMVRLQMLTGMRPAEVCKLSMAEIDRKEVDLWVYRPTNHKMAHLGRSRSVPLVREAIALLEPFLRADGKPLFSPADCRQAWEAEKRRKRKTKVQPSQQNRRALVPLVHAGEQYSTITYRRAIERGCKRAGVKTWSPNQLRKLAAQITSDLYGLDAARALLGHADSAITRRHYAQKDLAQGAMAAKGLASELMA